jgi:hypothetical protein
MSPPLPIDAGIARIQKAVAKNHQGLSVGQPVLYHNGYYESYEPTKLPKVKSRNDFHKTFLLNPSKQQYINFSLRAGVLALRKSASKQTDCHTKFVTIQLNKKASKKITTSVPSKTPTVYCNVRLRGLVFSKLGITEYFFVIEKSSKGGLHIHLLVNLPDGCEVKFRELLKQTNWLSINKHGMSNNSVVIKDSYTLKLFFNGLCKDEIDKLNAEIERTDYDSSWYLHKHIASVVPKSEWYIYHTVTPIGIDVGLADYLSKSLTDKLFGKGNWNYSISRELLKNMKPFREHLILESKTI